MNDDPPPRRPGPGRRRPAAARPSGRGGLVPERFLLPPAPAEAELADRWHSLPFDGRRALARCTVRGTTGLGNDEAAVVRGLGRARLATGWRLHLGALLLGWLVLMTLWGFGRSTFPASEGTWLAGGLVAGALVWAAAAMAVRRHLGRVREVLAASEQIGEA